MPETRWCPAMLENLAVNFTKPAQQISDFQKLDMIPVWIIIYIYTDNYSYCIWILVDIGDMSGSSYSTFMAADHGPTEIRTHKSFKGAMVISDFLVSIHGWCNHIFFESPSLSTIVDGYLSIL